MKFAAVAVFLVVLPACRTEPQDSRPSAQAPLAAAQAPLATSQAPRTTAQAPLAAEGTAEVLDFSAYKAKSMTVEEFVKACQVVSGFNFTYAKATGEAMGATSLRLAGPDRVPLPDFGSFLASQLHPCGFICERVGPDNVRMFLVKPSAM